ncbi:MAG TPA: hypothetical protein VK132_05940, partial [Gemmatimonadales bacterium]|nr:hypothetical protein [Gemmatimonadales bacterium]
VRILHAKVPGMSERFAQEIGRFVQALRRRATGRMPGIAETLDWARALVSLHRDRLDAEIVEETLGCLVKDQRGARELTRSELATLLAEAQPVEAGAG